MEKFYSTGTETVGVPKHPANVVNFVLRSCLLVLWLVLAGQLAHAQLYVVNGSAFQRYDVAGSGTVTTLASMTPVLSGNTAVIAGVGNYVYAGGANQTTLRRYDITANSWASMAASSNITTITKLFTDGASLYQKLNTAQANTGAVSKYDATAGTWTAVSSLTAVFATFSGVGVIYVLSTYGPGGQIQSYNATTNTVTNIGAIPTGTQSNLAFCADATNIYIVGASNVFTKVNIATGVATSLQAAPTNMPNGLASDGTNVYGVNGTSVYRYTASTNSWATLSTATLPGPPQATLAGSYYVAAAPVCAAPVISASVTQATCTSATVNSNGTITLTAFNANTKKVDYTIGSTYTGAGFASATTISGSAPYTITSTLPNPTVNQPYTIRVFCDATTYTDKTVLLAPKQCQTADLSLAVSPASQTGNSGEFLTYTVTLTNAGPNTATNVGVSVPMPDPTATLLSATAATGSYSSTTKKWTVPSLAVGSTTLTFTVKVN